MSSEQIQTNIYAFCDYRSFLKAHAQDCRRNNPRWSYAMWARRLNLAGTASLTMVLNGQRDAGPEIVNRLCRYFKFDNSRSSYFRSLVKIKKLENDPESSLAVIEQARKLNPTLRALDDREFTLISHWHYYAIRELIARRDFRRDTAWIAEQFHQRLSEKTIKHAIQTLLELKLVRESKDGRLRVNQSRIRTSSRFRSEAIRRYHEQVLDLARKAIRDLPTKQRNVRASTVNIKTSELEKAGALFDRFQNELEALLERSDGDATYQFSMQFFPLTVVKEESL